MTSAKSYSHIAMLFFLSLWLSACHVTSSEHASSFQNNLANYDVVNFDPEPIESKSHNVQSSSKNQHSNTQHIEDRKNAPTGADYFNQTLENSAKKLAGIEPQNRATLASPKIKTPLDVIDNNKDIIGVVEARYSNKCFEYWQYAKQQIFNQRLSAIVQDKLNAAAWCDYFKGDYETANIRFNSILRSNSSHFNANLGIAWINMKLGRYIDAKSYLDKAHEFAQTRSQVFFVKDGQAWLEFHKNDIAKAKLLFKNLDSFGAIGNRNAPSESLAGLGWVRFHEGDLEAARKNFYAAITRDDTCHICYEGLAHLALLDNQKNEALLNINYGLKANPFDKDLNELADSILSELNHPKAFHSFWYGVHKANPRAPRPAIKLIESSLEEDDWRKANHYARSVQAEANEQQILSQHHKAIARAMHNETKELWDIYDAQGPLALLNQLDAQDLGTIYSDNPSFYLLKAQAFFDLNDNDAAYHNMLRALKINPYLEDSYKLLRRIPGEYAHTLEIGLEQYQSGNILEAETAFNNAIAKVKTSPAGLLALALIYIDKGHPVDGVNLAIDSLTFEPNQAFQNWQAPITKLIASANYLQAKRLLDLGKSRFARTHAQWNRFYAEIYSSLQMPSYALRYSQTAGEINPTWVANTIHAWKITKTERLRSLASVGWGFYFKENYLKAIEYFEKAKPFINPQQDLFGYYNTIRGHGLAAFKLAQYRIAEPLLVTASQHEPNLLPLVNETSPSNKMHTYNALSTLGWSYYQLAQYEESIAAFRKFLSYYPDVFDINIGLSKALLNNGDIYAAAEYFNNALKIDPANPELTKLKTIIEQVLPTTQ